MSARGTPASTRNLDLDIQGIPWNLSRLSRAEYRLDRMREYAALEMRREPNIYIWEDLQRCTEEYPPIYEFVYLNRAYPCTAQHFQLRHLLWSPTVSSVYFTYGSTLMEWNPITNVEYARVNFREIAGAHSRITSICATTEYLLIGGFYGELVMRRTNFDGEEDENSIRIIRLTNDDNGITNQIKPYHVHSPTKFLVSSNDSLVRIYDAELNKFTEFCKAETAVNAASVSPNERLMCLATDSNTVDIIDVRTQTRALQLTGHIGYSFSCDWSMDGNWLCTGNEDHTARIYDVRSSSTRSLYVLGSRMAPVRNVLFSPDGLSLAVMEESDFVVIYDVNSNFTRCTTVDFFGETSGVNFSPDSEHCYIGCGETDRGGIIELKRPQSSILFNLESAF